MTAGIDFSSAARMSRRTSSCPRSVQPHIGSTADFANLSPSVRVITCSTKPVQVPQEAEALVCALTSVSELSPLSVIA